MKHPAFTTVLMSTLILAACAGSGRPDQAGNPFSEAGGERQLIQIAVQNNNFSDATLWAVVQNARRIRLGSVTGKTDANFTVPWRFSEQLRIEIDMMAGPRCITRPIDVDPGDVLQLEIRAVFQDTLDCTPR